MTDGKRSRRALWHVGGRHKDPRMHPDGWVAKREKIPFTEDPPPRGTVGWGDHKPPAK